MTGMFGEPTFAHRQRGEDATAQQVGGDHYSSLAIQPYEYINANGLTYGQGNVVKYVTRYKSKNGAEDLRKAIHYLRLMLAHEYGETE